MKKTLPLMHDESALELGCKAKQIQTLFGSDPVQKLLGRIRKLPSPPSIFSRIVGEEQAPADSRQPLLEEIFSCFESQPFGKLNMEALWEHSLATAELAGAIAEAENVAPEKREQSFIAGLSHDIGKLVLAANEPEEFQRAQLLSAEQGMPGWQAEQQVFGATHADLGAWLAATWGLPLSVVEAILLHHHPARLLSRKFCPLAAVHVANAFCHAELDGQAVSIDEGYLAMLGLQGRVKQWRELARSMGVSRQKSCHRNSARRKAA